MPERLLRDWTDSEAVNALDPAAERLFTRLLMKADDYGLYTADSMLLRANLFPRLIDQIREADITRWIAACEKAGLIRLYTIAANAPTTPQDSVRAANAGRSAQDRKGKTFLSIVNFGQRLRQRRLKYPLPPWIEVDGDLPQLDSNSPQSAATRRKSRPEAEAEVEEEKKHAAHARGKKVPLAQDSIFKVMRSLAGPEYEDRQLLEEAATFVSRYADQRVTDTEALVKAWVDKLHPKKRGLVV